MIAFPGMLVSAAEKAGIKCPPDPEEFEVKDFPHFHAFCVMQLGRPLRNGMSSHWDNAHIIAKIPKSKILTITPGDILAMGYI